MAVDSFARTLAAGMTQIAKDIQSDMTDMEEEFTIAKAQVGTPLTAANAAAMTDHNKIYVYVGDPAETGYTTGNWYFWNGTAWESGGVYNSTALQTDTTLSIAGMAADAKVTGDDITDLKNASYQAVPKILSNVSDYPTNVPANAFLVSSYTIQAGTYIKAARIYSKSASPYAYIYIIRKSDNKVVFKKTFSASAGWNVVQMEYVPESDCVYGFYGIPTVRRGEYSSNPVLITADYKFSDGTIQGSPLNPDAGDTVTLTITDSNTVQATMSQLYIADGNINKIVNSEDDKRIITAYDSAFTTAPGEMLLSTKYTETISLASFLVSDRVIPAGSYIKGVYFFNYSSSATLYVYVINATTNVVLDRFRESVDPGYITVTISKYYNVPVVIGIYGHTFKARKQTISAETAFSTGFRTATPAGANIGDTLTISNNNDGIYYEFPIIWDYLYSNGKNALPPFNGREYNILSGIENLGETIAAFVDDDSGVYAPSVWGEIIQETNIRMGFACVTGYMSGAVEPAEVYTQMTLAELKNFYDSGHEVYSHSYSHPAFYDATVETIETQCLLSQLWLQKNGFFRGSDTIIYPGGLGFGISKNVHRKVIRQFYKYGVEATGESINDVRQVLAHPYKISRSNADTKTLAELKAEVDNAAPHNTLLVFMNHAYQLNLDRSNQVNKMISFIEYVKSKNITIIPLSEALHRILGW